MIKEEEVQDISRALTHMLFRNVPLAEKIQTLSLEYNKRLYPSEVATQYIIHPKNFAVEGDIIKIPPYMFDIAFKQ